MITLIAAIGRNNEIGLDNKLLWNIPEDMKHFKEYTMGKVVIMGSKTYASIGKRSLPGRKCIVLTSKDMRELAITARTMASALSIEHCYPELVIIGGSSVYEQAMPYADKLVITHVDAEFTADTFFPAISLTNWQESSRIDSSNNTHTYSFVEYVRRKC